MYVKSERKQETEGESALAGGIRRVFCVCVRVHLLGSPATSHATDARSDGRVAARHADHAAVLFVFVLAGVTRRTSRMSNGALMSKNDKSNA